MNRTVVLAASILLLVAILLLSAPPSRTESNISPAPSETHAAPAPALDPKEIFTAATAAPQEGPASMSADTASRPKYSLSLNGAGAYVRVPNNSSLNVTETITVDAWIKTNSTSLQGIIERYKWLGTPDGGFALRLNDEGKLQFYTIRSSTEHDFVTASMPVSIGAWHHVAGVFDGSQLRVYLDGVLVGTKPSTVAPAPGTADLKIGVNGDSDAYFFNGLIDEARVTSGVRYNANFTPERDLIACKYTVEADGIGCRGVWTFNNQTAQDWTSFNNNGTLVGGAGFSADTNNYQPEEISSYQPEIIEANAPVGEQKIIHFDELGEGVSVNFRYPDIIFSAQGNLNVITYNGVAVRGPGSSPPHTISAAGGQFNTPIGVDFPKPVDNLTFRYAGQDDFGTIALVDIFQDNVYRATRPMSGFGRTNTALQFNVGAEFNHVTRIIIHHITDTAGLGYDDFVFNLPFVPPPVPFPPSNLRVTFAFATKIDLAWTDNSGNETEFKVERCTGATCNNFVQIARLPANTVNFRDENVSVNTTYTYRVRAANDGGNSDSSNWVNATPTLVTPRDLTARADSATQITLNWSNGSGFEQQGFSMERSTDGVNWRHILNLSANVREVTDISLEAGTTYHYRIRSYLNGQYSAYSNVASATTQACDFPTLNVEERFWFQFGHHFWDFDLELSDDDGLVAKNIRLDDDNSLHAPPGRLMANSISVPYYTIETTRFGPTRGELKLNSSDSVLRSRLIKVTGFQKDAYKIWFEATYSIDRLPNNSNSCLLITQRYEFYLRVPGDNCEPGGTLPCSRYRFTVNYDFRGNNGEQLKFINIVQRAHYAVDAIDTNTVGLFLDCDYPGLCAFVTGGRPVFRDKKNPLMTEISTRAVVNGEKGDFDNFHQTWNAWRVDEPAEGIVVDLPPAIAPGCPECVHSHWRWGYLLLGGEQRGYIIRLPRDSKQDINIAVTKFKRNGPDESDPISYMDLLNPLESIRRPNPNRSVHFIAGVPIILGSPTLPDEVVFWASAIGKQPSDTFFEYGGFFNPTLKNKREDIIKRNQNLSPSEVDSPATVANAPDRPTSVVFANLYRAGQTSYVDLVPTTKAPIPAGYAVYNQDGFDIGTTSVASGDHTVTFSVESVTDSTTFNKLRVFHAEQNGLNPEQVVWVDRTILPPNASSPDFANKTISAKADYLGPFFIGIKTDEPPVTVKSTDLAVTGTRSPDTVVSGENLTYTFNVANNGPEQATDAQLHVGLSVQEAFVSATPSQGSCSFNNTHVVCKLGNLSAGAGASVTVVLRATEGDIPLPSSGVMSANAALVIAGENDPNLNNNQLITNTRVLPNPNPPPAVRILSPATGQMFTGPTSVTLTAEATDSNGSISKVEFFDGDFLIGVAAAVGSNQYRFTWNNVPFGRHNIAAVATDNQGRAKISNTSYFIVNGSAAVNIISPANGAGFGIPTNLTITATASQSGGSIAKVEFYAGVFLVGTATTPNGNQYSVTWQNALAGTHSLTVVATDGAGITTTSNPVTVSIVDPATVNIISPLNGASFPQSPNIVIRAEARNRSGSISKVDFFANGAFIGTDATPGATQFFVDWNNVADGIYQLTAIATDNFGGTTTSAPVQITVNVTSPEPGELIWFDDALPAGATPITQNDDWYWVDANPGALLNGKAHQTRLSNDFHQHAFHNATFKLPINAGDRIFTYAFLDPNAMPSEIMLEWKAEDGWEHRAYWGLNKVEHLGANGTNSRRFMGALPFPGRWARLEVPAEVVGLNGKTLEGMSFILVGGKATFDRMGKTAAPPPPTPASGDVVWFDDALPAGATIPSDERVMKDDVWEWVSASPTPRSGGSSHRHFQAGDGEAPTYRSHAFVGANAPLVINPGDVLFTHIYLDPDPKYRPDQIILQWFDGQTWNHRAYWGGSFRTFGRMGTEHQRYMGGIPDAGRWVRLEIPASYVGLEGKSISGMAFGVNREQRLARAAWDLTGKSTRTTVPVLPLQSTVPIYRFFNSNEGYSYWINDIGLGNRIPQGEQWHVHPNRAAGTVPFYRFRNISSGQFFYTQFREGPGKPDANWTEDFDAFGSSVSFYLYPNNSTPGTVPLLLYRDPRNQNYFYTANPNDPAKALMSGACNGTPCTMGFVNATSPMLSPVPNPIDDPQFFVRQHYLDFFNREPDPDGLAFWTGQFSECFDPARRPQEETESACLERKRVDVSGAFFLSIEFQKTGYLLHKAYKASFGSMPVYQKFMPDLRTIGQGVVVLQPGWEQLLESNKRAFFDQWVTRPEFRAAYDNRSHAQYVDQLFANAGVGPQPERDALVNGLNSGTETRATVLRKVAELNDAFNQAEFRPAFVLMQYFGYLRRHPSDPPNVDMSGFNFWLTKLNNHNGDWRSAEMVKSFIVSGEYRGRFGQPVSPVTINSVATGQNVSVKSGVVTSKFSLVSSQGTMAVMPAAPWALGSPPVGYSFYNNVGYNVSTTSNVSAPITLDVSLAWQVDDPAWFADLRVLVREGDAWVDRTILAPDAPAPNFATRTISARVNSLPTFAIARVASSNLAPGIGITSPVAGQSFNQPASITINASASDADGSISKVEFYQGSTLLGVDTAAPYTFNWNNVTAGNYTLTVRATDSGSVTTTSAGVDVTVHGPPTVSITSPSNNTSFDAPASFSVSAAADDPNGIRQVEFFQGTTSLGVDTTAPYEVNWSGVGVGTYSLKAVATDNLNATTVSNLVAVTVSNSAPTVAITSPASGTAAGNAPASITINCTASDSNGIRQVEFFSGTTSLGVDIAAPFSLNWNNVGVGTHTLTAKATDNLNAVTTSSPVSVTVSNSAPSVVITSPANGSSAGAAPASITIAATATDNEGISKVEFFSSTSKVGEDTTAPYTFVWNNVAVGTYSLTARATDTLNATTTSAAVSVSVGNAPPSVSITSPSAGTNYTAPASVLINATATDNEGISKVEFFQGATRLGEDTTAPYNFTWANVPTGTYSLTVKATDSLNAVTTSSAVSISVGSALFTLFADDFNDNVMNVAKWSVPDPASATTVAERNQRLEVTPATAQAVTAYNGYVSVPTIDFTNAQVTVEVLQYAPTYGHETYLKLYDSTGNYLLIDAGGGGLVLQDSATGQAGRVVITTYNTTQHRFWRLRHDPSTDKIIWETSSDNLAWATQRTVTRPFAITAMQVMLGGGKYAGVASSPATAVFDNLKVESPVANNSPSVSITSPASGASFIAPANITINATASDSDGNITRVEFLAGTTSLGVDNTAPFSFNWANVAAGSYSLTARAIDNRGAIVTSAPVTITVGANAAPAVSLTAPANNAIFHAGSNITLSASASDSDGSISGVEFFQNGTSLGVDNSAPYSVSWPNPAVGNYTLTARATDNAGASTASGAVSIIVNALPSISITAPASGYETTAGSNIVINATASDNDGTIASVEFFSGTTSLGVDTTAPFSFNWNNVAAGSYSLTAKATDNRGATKTSSAVSITVKNALYTLFADDFNDNTLDTAKWFMMTPGAATTVIERNQRLELTPPTAASVSDYNGIASVMTFDITNAQATLEVPQHSVGYGHETYLTLSDNSTGHYLLFVAGGGGLVLQDSATGSAGRTVITSYNTTEYRFWRLRHNPAADTIVWETSADGSTWSTRRTAARTFAITSMQVKLLAGKYAGVEAPLSTAVFDNLKVESPIANNPPTASITNPLNGAVFTSPANINIDAAASDADGAVRQVEFFSGTTSLGVDTTAPYSFAWNNVAAGNYSITVKASDNRGGTTTSAPVSLSVNSAPAVTLTTPANGATYTSPANVSVAASASDSDGTISKVEFFRNGVSIGVDTTSPYSVNWSNVAAGTYALTATATDNRGTSTTSATVNITVSAPPNLAPSVSLTAPAQGAVFTGQSSITLAASASDSDGSVTGVEFFQNGLSLGTDATAPYSFNWTGVPAGSYSLTAKATDNQGAMTTSSPVNITVNSTPVGQHWDTIGLYTGYVFHLRNSNTSGPADIVTPYGTPGWIPVVGDWDSNGTATLGVFVPEATQQGAPGQSLFYLSNRLDYSYNDTTVIFGLPGDKPLAGDWDGDGTATVGVYRPSNSTFYLRNSNTTGPADLVIALSASGDTPVSGDWDGDGIDTIGIHNSSTATFYLRNSNTSGSPSLTIGFGSAGDKPVVGDWDGDGKMTVGAYRAGTSTFYLRNSNTMGAAEIVFQFGSANSYPLAGNWDGMRVACCGDVVWFDDSLPYDSVTALDEDPWRWGHFNPIPFSGTMGLQSSIKASENSYLFTALNRTLAIAAGDKLFAYVYLDPANLPSEIMLQWSDDSWEHRAYWGANNIDLGVDGTNSRRYMGPLPPAGRWVRLEVPAAQVGLEGSTLNGMQFHLYDGRATWDRVGKTTAPAGSVIISEFRFRGSAGEGDEFVELYNRSSAPVTVCATDGSGGWALVASDGVIRFTVPNGTVIPAFGHYLASGGGYSLGAYAVGDKSYTAGIEDNTGVALFSTRNPAGFNSSNRLDAVGFNSLTNTLYFEGTGLQALGPVDGEYSFIRKQTTGTPQDTNNNEADFAFISVTGDLYGSSVASMLGSPGPENLFDMLPRSGPLALQALDPAVSTTVSPNRTRYQCEATQDCNPTTAPLGTVVIRRRVVNNSSATVTALRFRVVDVTTLNSPGYTVATQADVRLITSGDSNVTLTDGSTVAVKGMTLEQPPNQPNGGGYNSTARVTLPAGGLPPGGSINVQFVLGVKRGGSFSFLVTTWALP